MTKFRADNATWIQTGKKAADAGKNGEALYALCTLMSTLFFALETVVENQFELYDAINRRPVATPAPAASNGSKP